MWALESAGRSGRRQRLRVLALAAVLIAAATAVSAADRDFPFDQELMLQAKQMRGSKRVPMLDIRANGDVAIDLWCATVRAQFVVAQDTITIVAGAKTAEQCAPDRMGADDDLLDALSQVTNWSRQDDVLTLRGPTVLRFRTMTH
jgi:heat shock protein HslJ